MDASIQRFEITLEPQERFYVMRTFVLTIITGAVLCACGGGGTSASNNSKVNSGNGSNDNTGGGTTTGTTLSGTAAGGAPMVGTVVVKHANGETAPVSISSDGTYSVDVSQLTGPFVIKATGTVGGQATTYYSVATASDVGAKVNVTPLSSLITANLAGGRPENFDTGTSIISASVNATAIGTAVSNIKAMLAPVLQTQSISTTFDPLHSTFTANGQGFDAALDLIRVEFDSEDASKATLRNVVTGQTVQDNLASNSDSTVIASPSSDMASAITNLQGIRQTLSTLSSLLTNGMPNDTSSVVALHTVDYVDKGITDPITTILGGGTNAEVAGVSFKDPVIVKQFTETLWLVTLGIRIPNQPIFNTTVYMKKVDGSGSESTTGTWKIAGDQLAYDINMYPVGRQTDGSSTDETAIAFNLMNAPSNVRTMTIQGPGLVSAYTYVGSPSATDTLVFKRSPGSTGQSGFWSVNSNGSVNTGNTWLGRCATPNASTCLTPSDIRPGNAYVVRALDANGAEVRQFTAVLKQRLPSANSVSLGVYASALSTNKTLSQMSSGSSVSVSWTLPASLNRPDQVLGVELELTDSTGTTHSTGLHAFSDGAFTASRVTLTVPNLSGNTTLTSGRIIVTMQGEGNTQYTTFKALN